MKLFAQLLTLGLLGQGVVASNWFSKSSKFDLGSFFARKEIYPSSVSTEARRHRSSSYQIAVCGQQYRFSCVVIDI